MLIELPNKMYERKEKHEQNFNMYIKTEGLLVRCRQKIGEDEVGVTKRACLSGA
jgi:hypothetical protein